MVAVVGLEPTRLKPRFLRPMCMPIPPYRHVKSPSLDGLNSAKELCVVRFNALVDVGFLGDTEVVKGLVHVAGSNRSAVEGQKALGVVNARFLKHSTEGGVGLYVVGFLAYICSYINLDYPKSFLLYICILVWILGW